MNVLLVEDNACTAEAMRLLLELEDWRVEEAATGRQALAALDGPPADVVLLDHHLPGVDGLDVLKEMRRRGPWEHVPVLLVTAAGEQMTRGLTVESRDLAPIELIRKPVEPARLLELVREMAGGGEHEQD